MPTWPAGMPDPILPEIKFTGPQGAVLRTSMSSGPAKTRPRFTAATKVFELSFAPLSPALLTTFEDFYEADLAMGSLEFDMTHPITGVVRSFRFMETYEGEEVGGGAYQVNVKLELLP